MVPGKSTVSFSLDILHRFDAKNWHTAPPPSVPGATTVLFTWTMTPPWLDAGIPEPVARLFAEALCSIGPVVYAGEHSSELHPAEKLIIRRGFRRFNMALFCATSAADLLPAFSDSAHDWSMNAQWLIVVDLPGTTQNILDLARVLYGDWTMPECWPVGVRMIVQAAVDGDGAACHSVSEAIEERFIAALNDCAHAAGVELRIDPAIQGR
jgi:hypothetical protein